MNNDKRNINQGITFYTFKKYLKNSLECTALEVRKYQTGFLGLLRMFGRVIFFPLASCKIRTNDWNFFCQITISKPSELKIRKKCNLLHKFPFLAYYAQTVYPKKRKNWPLYKKIIKVWFRLEETISKKLNFKIWFDFGTIFYFLVHCFMKFPRHRNKQIKYIVLIWIQKFYF